MNITIVEPHSDDAWINLGGYILKNPDINFKIVTVCRDVTNSKNETAILPSIIKNVETKILNYTGVSWYIRNKIKPGTHNRHFNYLNRKFFGLYWHNAMKRLRNDLQLECRDADLVLLPLGTIHPQHIIVSKIDLDKPCKYYPEFPYLYNHPIDFSKHRVDGLFIDINDVLNDKIDVFTQIYKSQTGILTTKTKAGQTLHQIDHEIIFDSNIRDNYSVRTKESTSSHSARI